MKVCKKCGKEVSVKEFCKNKNHPDGYAPWCRSCVIAYRNKREPNSNKRDKLNKEAMDKRVKILTKEEIAAVQSTITPVLEIRTRHGMNQIYIEGNKIAGNRSSRTAMRI